MDRNEAIKRIRTALQKRSGKAWSVTGGRGTAWGWLTIDAPPARRTWHFEIRDDAPFTDDAGNVIPWEQRGDWTNIPGKTTGSASPDERRELAQLLGKDWCHQQGESVPPGAWMEYVERAEGKTPTKVYVPDWD